MIHPKLLTFYLFLIVIVNSTYSQRGKEGDITITGNTVVNSYTILTSDANAGATSISVDNNQMIGGSFNSNLTSGDLILIIQMQGATMDVNTTPVVIWGANYTVPNDYLTGVFGANPHLWGQITNYGNSGVYERVEVLSVSGANTINLNCPLTKNFTVSGHVQIVRIPRYNNLTIPSSNSIIPTDWDGNTGGVIALEVKGSLTLNGDISATGSGFRGGELDPNSYTASGAPNQLRVLGTFDLLEGSEKGEGIGGFYTEYDDLYSRYGIGAPANGGGGGGYQNAGGGGGSNVVVGGTYTSKGNPIGYSAVWDLESAGFGGSTSSGGGRGGYALSDVDADELVVGPGNAGWGGDDRKNTGGFGGHPLAFAVERVFAGGGGGAGDQNNGQGGAGGAGGGIVLLQVYGAISGAGTIEARGLPGQNSNPNNEAPSAAEPRKGIDGAGGGGAGGSIYIENISSIPASYLLDVSGGNGGNHNISLLDVSPSPPLASEASGPGGSGSGGVVRIGTGTPTINALSGASGVTNSAHMINFPPNGATAGSDGHCCHPNIPSYDIIASNQSVCNGSTADLTASVSGVGAPLPNASALAWYADSVGGPQLSTGAIFTTPVITGTTTYWVGVCPGTFRTPVTVSIAPPLNASINYTENEYCKEGVNPTPTITGVSGGVFSSTSGLILDASTGEIDLDLSNPGVYDIVYTVNGTCGTTSTNLVINSVSDISTDLNGSVVSANNINASYVWLDCDDNYSILTGETSQDFTAISNGNYAVELTENGCVDTSDCITVETIGLIEKSDEDLFSLYPNPTKRDFDIFFYSNQKVITISLLTISGQVLESKTYQNVTAISYNIDEPSGVYLVKIKSFNNQEKIVRIVKE